MQSIPLKSADLYGSAAFLSPFLLRNEPELIATKWEPYRSFSPVRCNREFVRAYQAAFKDHVRMHIDYRLASNVKGISTEKFTPHGLRSDVSDKNGEVLAVHAARQDADRTGLPYYTFIRFCMEFASNRSVRNIVRPNQLVPMAPARERDVAKRDQRKRILDAFMTGLGNEMDLLPTLRSRYQTNNPGVVLSPVPGCLGIPDARTSPTCQSCAYATKCGTVAEIVGRQIESKQRKGEPTWEVKYQCRVAQERERALLGMRKTREKN